MKRILTAALLALPGALLVLAIEVAAPPTRESGERLAEPIERAAAGVSRLLHRTIDVSEEEENAYGRRLANAAGTVDDAEPSLVGYVQRVGAILAPRVRRKGIRYEFHVMKTAEANAFALPGGKIYITTALLEQLRSEAELAGILAHEIGHVDLQHCVDAVRDRIAAEREGRGAGSLSEDFSTFLKLAFGEAQEKDADEYALILAAEAGYDPQGLISVFDRLAAAQAPPPRGHRPIADLMTDALRRYLDTHPPFPGRLESLSRIVRGHPEWAGRSLYLGAANYRDRRTRLEEPHPEEFITY